MRRIAVATLALAAPLVAGCREGAEPSRGRPIDVAKTRALVARGPAVVAGAPVGRLRCQERERVRVGVHVELFVDGRAVLLPAGIGLAPPLRREGAYVRAGRCAYAVRTREPTGVVEVDPAAGASLGDLFDVWGQPLSRARLARWSGRVRVFVDGRRRQGDPRSVALRRHAQIVLEVGHPEIAPNARYRFPPGL